MRTPLLLRTASGAQLSTEVPTLRSYAVACLCDLVSSDSQQGSVSSCSLNCSQHSMHSLGNGFPQGVPTQHSASHFTAVQGLIRRKSAAPRLPWLPFFKVMHLDASSHGHHGCGRQLCHGLAEVGCQDTGERFELRPLFLLGTDGAAAAPRREAHVIIFGKVGKGTQMYMNSGSVTFN